LTRPSRNGTQNARNVGTSVRPQTDERSGRQFTMHRIDDDAEGRERQAAGERHFGGNVRFHVDGGGAGAAVKRALVPRFGDRGIDPGNVAGARARHHVHELA